MAIWVQLRWPVPKQSEIHQHSGWVIPLGFLATVVLLSGLVLLYYLRPAAGLFRDNRPTAAVTMVTFTLHGTRLVVPANYLESRAGQNGGDVDSVSLLAALPDMRGFSESDSALFAGDAADSPVLHLVLGTEPNKLDAATRLARIYRPAMVDAKGEPGPSGLTRFWFRAGAGYGANDLYAGEEDGRGLLLLLCERPAQDLPSPNCLAIDRPVAPQLSLSYRFKRSQLADWRAIDQGVRTLVLGFRRS